jgi:hypothetical protein
VEPIIRSVLELVAVSPIEMRSQLEILQIEAIHDALRGMVNTLSNSLTTMEMLIMMVESLEMKTEMVVL